MSDFLSSFVAFLIGIAIGKIIVFSFESIHKKLCKHEHISVKNEEIFSTGKYLEEIGKVHLSILEERENQEPYIITLWWGLDGIRLGEDGKPEWISRRTKTPENLHKENANSNYEVIQDIFGNQYVSTDNTVYVQSPYLYQNIYSGIQNMTDDINSSIQSQNESIRQLQFQAAQMAQDARLLESLSTARDISGRIIRYEN